MNGAGTGAEMAVETDKESLVPCEAEPGTGGKVPPVIVMCVVLLTWLTSML